MSPVAPATCQLQRNNWARLPRELISREKWSGLRSECFGRFDSCKAMRATSHLKSAVSIVVLMNFGLLHVSHPEKACAEACRVLKRGGKFGFAVWAGPEQNPGAKIVNDAVEAYADLDVGLPEGPPKYLYGEREECRQVLKRAGFDGASMSYETRTVEWKHPHAGYYFEAERNAGVRTAGILARQSPETLEKIRIAIENGIKQHAQGNEFAVPMGAHVVVVSKN
jgi:SAM-dependent methyltransferase